MNRELYQKFADILGEEKVLLNEPMKKHTTFRVGGPADFFLMPASFEETARIIKLCEKEGAPYYIVGNGSNLLVSDQGYRGVIVQLYKNISSVKVSGKKVYAQAGASLAKIAGAALEESLTGFEFAAGIPGTLGGACVMNAGAYEGEMKDVLREVKALTKTGETVVIPRENLELGYRTSIFAKKSFVVLEAVLELEYGDRKLIKARMDELKNLRASKQPLEYPSAGSTFKRPEGFYAGKLIQDAGLCGFQIGGAQVSEKHCGFVINTGQADAGDIDSLMRVVAERVEEKFGVRLEPEVKKLGEF